MKALGIVEFNSIPKGIKELDKIIKFNELKIYKAGVTCPGKYYFIVYGDNSSVKDGLKDLTGERCKQVISGVSEKLLEALNRKREDKKFKAIGVVEFLNIADGVKVLDHVIKSVDVDIVKLVLGWTLAGKCYFVVGGETSSIDEAIVLVTGSSYKYMDISKINNPVENILDYI